MNDRNCDKHIICYDSSQKKTFILLHIAVSERHIFFYNIIH